MSLWQQIIETVEAHRRHADLPEAILQAAFLFEKARLVPEHEATLGLGNSQGWTQEVMDEPVDLVRRDQLISSLEHLALERPNDPGTGSIFWALSKVGDAARVPFFQKALRQQVHRNPGSVFQILIALENLGEESFPRGASRSVEEVEENGPVGVDDRGAARNRAEPRGLQPISARDGRGLPAGRHVHGCRAHPRALFPLDPADGPAVLNEATPDLGVELVSRALGTEIADGTERGLDATWLALSGPHARTHNAGFLRNGAYLSVIAVTDTSDLSERSVNDWIDDLRAIAGFRRTNLVSVSAIVGDLPGGCSGPGGHASASPRWIAVADGTGGVFQSICAADWSRSLEDLSTAAFSSKFKRWLSALPASPPTVRVDGTSIPATSVGGTVNWEIDPAVPAIVFSPFATPEPGARVEVDYAIACDWRG